MHGWEDQRWTLARIRALIAWQFRPDCSVGGGVAAAAPARLVLAAPARRALERDEHAVGLWKKDVWPQAE